MDIDGRISQMVGKLDRLRRQDLTAPVNADGGSTVAHTCKVFDADEHRYQIRPPVDPDVLHATEQLLGQRVPDEYRHWITQVGDGIAGPCYGLLPLTDNKRITVDLGADFPYSFDQPCRMSDGDDPSDGWGRRMATITNGIKLLADEGCGMYDALVLRGPSKGQVWWLETADYGITFPLADPGTGAPLGFLDWYELWLDSALDGPEQIGGYCDFIPPHLTG